MSRHGSQLVFTEVAAGDGSSQRKPASLKRDSTRMKTSLRNTAPMRGVIRAGSRPVSSGGVTSPSRPTRTAGTPVSPSGSTPPPVRQLDGDFDAMLEEIGGFGRFQWRMLALLQAPFMFLSVTLLSQIWLLLEPDHWCRDPQLEALGWSAELIRNVTIPREVRAGSLQFVSCERYDVNFSALDAATFQPDEATPRAACRHGWQYDFSVVYPTLTSDLDWVCDQAWKPVAATSLFFVGSVVGTLLFGAVADRHGRLPGLIAANLTACVSGVASAFTVDFYTFAAARFVFGMANNLQSTLATVYLSEIVGADHRGMVVNLPMATSCLGMILLPWIAWGAGHWRYTALATSAPMAFVLVYLVVDIPESCRWLQQTGQLDKAVKNMRAIARENGRAVSDDTWMLFTAAARRKHELEKAQPQPSLRQLLRHRRLRTRMLVLMFSTTVLDLLFDLTSRNTEFDVDIYTALTLLAVSEAPADLLTWLLVDTLGRRWTITAATALTSAAGLALAALLHLGTAAAASTAVAVLCRFCTTIAVNVLMTSSMELIPTAVRSRAFSVIQVAGHVGSMFSPVILYLERVARGLPQLVLAALALLGAVSVSFLPETRGRPLPDSLEEGDQFGVDQRWLECYCRNKHEDDAERCGVDNAGLDVAGDVVTHL